MAGSTATCAGAPDCTIVEGTLGVSPGTSITGNFDANILPMDDANADCAKDGLAAWKAGRAMSGTTMLAEMRGLTFTSGVYVHGSAINVALSTGSSTKVYLDAEGVPNAQFVFNIGTTLTTSANSEVVLLNGARADNVFWVLGTALTLGADSILVGNVLAGSAITMGTNAKIFGRAIAQTAVTCETACIVDSSVMSMGSSYLPSSFPSSGVSIVPSNQPEDDPFQGCYMDSSVRTIPKRISGGFMTKIDCFTKSKTFGATFYGLQWWNGDNNQNTGECWYTQSLDITSLTKATNCVLDGNGQYIGGAWSNAIYSIKV
jgi:hypothetical protein